MTDTSGIFFRFSGSVRYQWEVTKEAKIVNFPKKNLIREEIFSYTLSSIHFRQPPYILTYITESMWYFGGTHG